MLTKIQERSPVVAWAVVGSLLLAGAWLVVRSLTKSSMHADLAGPLIIRFEDTGEQIEMIRGMFEQDMLGRASAGPVDPAVGVFNPKTGKPTGFPVDREYWISLVESLNKAFGHGGAVTQGGRAGE